MNEIPIVRSVPSEASTRHFDPILRPELHELYTARAARLRELAQGHELEAYLQLAADIAQAQAQVSEQAQSDADAVDPVAIARQGAWTAHLDSLLEQLAHSASPAISPHLDALRAMSTQARREAGLALAQNQFDAVSQALAPFLWATLSLEVALAARALPLPANSKEESASCPVCGGAPVASLIYKGTRQGLRYLHCSLCECEWHMVRAKCTNCADAGDLDYLSFETTEAVVRAESCGHCHSYLKVISQERDAAAESVADDLASLVLDDAATEEGYGRTGLNPFALPDQAL
ncbi:formate dehydrogenase accessory protein FdhE [Alcaligenes faecalis]|jgi:FdhE protein|uniref:formate dehydrogenase accessory protein FdhE n=1 Tax=Alcaligenes faecalis TaxID=511 RepID=UPI0019320B71|nr:formate dehydrogenase accessory protein FdhE [Alcaligenes faecalis]QRF89785.1 formate dehydrogenase accessory protein FdhE [Alcaligenes faecalis]